ncbi:MAG: hypothetical protein P3W96_006265 [Halomonas sp.]|nr:hypothetical protein [Halomonas sp.]MDM7481606.1 hypothetical protein [Halomonas sp.]
MTFETTQPEPDWRHPKIQGIIGANARLRYELALVEQILEQGVEADFTPTDSEYLTPLHDRLLAVMEELEALRRQREDAKNHD